MPLATAGSRGLATNATFTLHDDASDAAVSCSVPIMTGVDVRSCNSGDATATISPGSELSLKVFVNGGGGTIAGKIRFGWRALTP